MTDETKLMPCPFCGESDQDKLLIEHMAGTVLRPAYRVVCDYCGASTGYSDRGDHVKEWNTRAALAASQPADPVTNAGSRQRSIEGGREMTHTTDDELDALDAKLASQIGDDVAVIFNHEYLFKQSRASITALRAQLAAANARADTVAETIRQAVQAEREACAKICDGWKEWNSYTTDIAAAIRARGDA